MQDPVPFLYEDNHLLLADKPPGLLTQDSGTGDENLEDILKEYCRIRDNKQGGFYLKPLHRLDRVTGGIVLFAKSKKALDRLLKSIAKKEWKKTYLVAVEGRMPHDEGSLENYLSHGDMKSFVCEPDDPDAKLASLHYKLQGKYKNIRFYQVTLETGRYHQIRCQLSFLECPIWGDLKYGSTIPFPYEGIALQHNTLEILHPVKKEDLKIEASKPLWYLD